MLNHCSSQIENFVPLAYENLTRPVTNRGRWHSNSYSHGDTYPGPPFLQNVPLQAHPHILQRPLSASREDGQYVVMGMPTSEGNTKHQDEKVVYDQPHNVNEPQLAYFPEGYVVMLSPGRADPYHTIPTIHRGGFPVNSNEQYRSRNKSDTLPVFRHPVTPQTQGSRSHSIPNILVSANPLVSHGNSLPQGDDQTKSSAPGQETRADTPFTEVTMSENSDVINCVPLYLSMATGKVYIDQNKAVAFPSHQLVDVSKIACLGPPCLPPTRPVSLLLI